MSEVVEKLLQMMSPDYDWDEHWADPAAQDFEDIFRKCTTTFGSPWSRGYYECGSAPLEETPCALYRLLFLCQPKAVDFSDMYKTYLFSVASTDLRFMVAVELFKYELGLYFYTSEKDAVQGERSFIIAGHPGADNGILCNDPDGVAFFEMIRKATMSTRSIYPGNDFEV